jgi:uncharacterized protein
MHLGSSANLLQINNNFLYNQFIEDIKKDPDILAVYLYGSSVKGTDYNDIDLCILTYKESSSSFFKKYISYSGAYAAIGEKPLDISLFFLLPLYIRIRVIREGMPIYIDNRDFLLNLILKTNREWDDFEPSYRILIE